MSHDDTQRLDRTLEDAGLTIRSEDVEILAASGAEPRGNARVHERTNERILDLLDENRLGRCIHITGDARALIDPFHRELCNLIHRDGERSFSVLYKLPADRRSDPVSTVAYNLERWTSKGQIDWRSKYLAISTIGNRSVDMLASDRNDRLQYSVFGNEYIQLQAPHDPNAKVKPIWLLRSQRLNEHLVDRAEKLLSGATDVEESWFSRFRMLLNSVMSTYMLRHVRDAGDADRDGLLGERRLDLLPEDPQDVLRALQAMDLIRDEGGRLRMTPAGAEFLEAA